MSDSKWRAKAAPIIAAVIAEHHGKALATIRKHLRDAYPWGQKSMHPYRIWCDEVRRQLLLECLPPGFPEIELKSEAGRGICADWWTERGDQERAKFLRSLKHVSAHSRKFGTFERQRIDRLYAEAMAKQGADDVADTAEME